MSDETGRVSDERDWIRYAIWWQVYPLAFLGADTTGRDRRVRRSLTDLIAWLDYAVDLGVSGLSLGPLFASDTHGYDTRDHRRIDERLGTAEDADALIAACHARGVRVMFDGVFNHVGRHHPAFRRVVADGPQSDAADWFHLHWPADWSPGTPPHYRSFEGHEGLVELNHSSPAVVDEVVDVMRHWLDRGVDAWRLDAAYAVPTTFWAEVLPRVRAHHLGAYIVGEVIHGDYPALVAETGMDAVTQYELWKAIWSSLHDRNLYELAWAMGRHNEMLDTFVPLTFVGNHDVTRIASQLSDPALLPHALLVLMTLPGTPVVYYGDEQGFAGIKEERFGGDDAVRPAFPATPSDLPDTGRPLYHVHQDLIGLRRRHPWLEHARTETLHLANEQLSYRVRAGADALVVALNLAAHPADVPVPGAGEVIEGTVDGTSDAGALLPGHGWAVLSG